MKLCLQFCWKIQNQDSCSNTSELEHIAEVMVPLSYDGFCLIIYGDKYHIDSHYCLLTKMTTFIAQFCFNRSYSYLIDVFFYPF